MVPFISKTPSLKHLRPIAILLCAGLVACSTPEERVADFTESGNELMAAGSVKKATLEYRNALQINADHLPALRGLLSAMEVRENQRQIIAILKRLVELDESDVNSRVRLARIYLIGGAINEARDLTEQAIALQPDNASALAISAGVLLRLEDLSGAVTRARESIAVDPAVTDAYQVLAAERVIANDLDGAVIRIDEGIAASANPNTLRLIKIELLTRSGRMDEAINVFDQLVMSKPNDDALLRQYGFFLARNDQTSDAKVKFESLIDRQPENDQAVIDLARLLLATEGSEKAEDFIQNIVKQQPDRFTLRRFAVELIAARGDTDGAIQALKAIESRASQNPDYQAEAITAKSRRAEFLWRSGKRDEAEALVAEILEEDKKNNEAKTVRAAIALTDNRIDDAIADLRTVLRDAPQSVPVLVLLAKAHEVAGSNDLAEDRYAEAFRVSRGNPDIGLQYSQLLVRQQNYALAEDVLGASLGRYPDNLELWRAVAQIRLLRSDWAGAQAAAQRIKELGSEDEAFVNQVSGAAYGGLKQYDESLDAFKKAHEAAPQSARPLTNLLRAYVAADRVPDAIEFLDNLVKGNLPNPAASLLLAEAYSLNDQPEKVEPTLLAAREDSPDNIAIHQALYQLYMNNDQLEDADSALTFAEGMLPENLQLTLLRAGYFERVQNYEAAIAKYEAIIEKQPDTVVVVNNLASLLAEHRDDAESLNRALTLAEPLRDSEIPHFRDTLAWANFRSGNVNEAVSLLEGVVKQLPNLPIFRYHLGRAYLEQGKKDAAKDQLAEALKLAQQQESADEQRIRRALDTI